MIRCEHEKKWASPAGIRRLDVLKISVYCYLSEQKSSGVRRHLSDFYMDPQEYAKEGVDKVYPEYNWMPSTGVQRGSIKSTPIHVDPQTPGFSSVGTTILILVISKRSTL